LTANPEGAWIGVDPGTRHVGVAVGDAASKVAAPLKVLGAKPESALMRALAKIATEHAARGFVVGLPLNMDGTEGAGCKTARAFAAKLADAAKLPVELVDERLSSFEAEDRLIEGGLKPSERRMRVHAVSAALLLEAFFRV
jgi:putative Holliday junction resolvase